MYAVRSHKLRLLLFTLIGFTCYRIYQTWGSLEQHRDKFVLTARGGRAADDDPRGVWQQSVDSISPLFRGKSFFPSDEGGEVKDGNTILRREFLKRSYRDTTNIYTAQKKKRKLVLFWSRFFGKSTPPFPVGSKKFEACASRDMFNDCFLTYNRSLLDQSDVIVFHMFDLAQNKSDIPPYRYPGHIWVLYGTEAPSYAPVHHLFDGKFNFTMTYRRDADFRYNYGSIVPRKPNDRLSTPLPDMTKGKTKIVTWANSHCNTSSRREEYAKELQKHIPVDIFGFCSGVDCGDKKTPEGHKICAEKMKEYKFCLAFENSLCDEYITEKVYRIMNNGLVPVVLGNSFYEHFLPTNSYIDIRYFASPKDLAKYLYVLNDNDALYNKYFEWKHNYTVVSSTYHFCEMCHFLNTRFDVEQVYSDIHRWWNVGCMSPEEFYEEHFEFPPRNSK